MWPCKVWQKTADIIVPLAVVVNNLGPGPGGVSLCKVSFTFYAKKQNFLQGCLPWIRIEMLKVQKLQK